jgi:hypothetical protein
MSSMTKTVMNHGAELIPTGMLEPTLSYLKPAGLVPQNAWMLPEPIEMTQSHTSRNNYYTMTAKVEDPLH